MPPHPDKENYVHLDMDIPYIETWKAVHALLKTGKVKAVGVSNLSHHHLKKVVDETGIVPVSWTHSFIKRCLNPYHTRLSIKSRPTRTWTIQNCQLIARRRTL